jgi:lipoyl(octanoyl) transferase
MPYAEALSLQRARHASLVASREHGGDPMSILLVEHDPPVVTITPRPGVAEHLLVDERRLTELGIELAHTDRGGDITYHGPGQLVVYPILDLNRLGLRIHPYLRLLEEAVLRTLGSFGLRGVRDDSATGVWLPGETPEAPTRKICAMGVRLSRWCSMHGLALNVDPDLSHFDLIVPCGLAGRPVTSLRRELGPDAPDLAEVREELVGRLVGLLREQAAASDAPSN